MSADARRIVRAEALGDLVVFALPGVLFWSWVLGSILVRESPFQVIGEWVVLMMILALVSAACGVGAFVTRAHTGLKVLVALLGFSPLAALVLFVAAARFPFFGVPIGF